MTASSPSAARAAVNELEGLLAKATPGPWIADGSEVYELCPGTTDVPGGWIGETCRVDSDPLGPGDADAALIVAAVNALPHLLAAIKAVDELATGWASRCPAGDWGSGGIEDAVIADAGREVLRALALAAVDVTETADGAS